MWTHLHDVMLRWGLKAVTHEILCPALQAQYIGRTLQYYSTKELVECVYSAAVCLSVLCSYTDTQEEFSRCLLQQETQSAAPRRPTTTTTTTQQDRPAYTTYIHRRVNKYHIWNNEIIWHRKPWCHNVNNTDVFTSNVQLVCQLAS